MSESRNRLDQEQPLEGGVANAGAVVRVGDHVLRPSSPHSDAIHRFLVALRDTGFHGAPVPGGVAPGGRERFGFIEGDVAIPPYPAWAQSDRALASMTVLMRDFHAASARVDPGHLDWSRELADPNGGPIVCHNDVCMENVVFRDGEAIALLDFDFAAPGRPIYDLARFARMCVPIDADANTRLLGWARADRIQRLRLVADTYGLGGAGRRELLRIIAGGMGGIGAFVKRRLEAGDEHFIKMWRDMGGAARFIRRRDWFDENRRKFEAAMR